jgi:hypothetical protein
MAANGHSSWCIRLADMFFLTFIWRTIWVLINPAMDYKQEG